MSLLSGDDFLKKKIFQKHKIIEYSKVPYKSVYTYILTKPRPIYYQIIPEYQLILTILSYQQMDFKNRSNLMPESVHNIIGFGSKCETRENFSPDPSLVT